jgi:hypothetical protein
VESPDDGILTAVVIIVVVVIIIIIFIIIIQFYKQDLCQSFEAMLHLGLRAENNESINE